MELIPVLSLVMIGYAFLSGLLAIIGAGKGKKFKALGFFLVISALIAVTIVWWEEYSYVFYLIAAVVAFVTYLEVIKYRFFDVRNAIVKVWNYVTLASCAVIVYVIFYYFIAKELFHFHVNSDAIAINMIMILILVVILPILNGLNTAINARVLVQRVDLTYVIKRLNFLATHNVKLASLAAFLAKNLHFKTVGIVVDGKLYASSKKMRLSKDEISSIAKLKDSDGVWQKISGKTEKTLNERGIKAVAVMRDAKGHPFGQVLIGQPMGKIDFEKRDLNEVSAILNLVASIVDSKNKD